MLLHENGVALFLNGGPKSWGAISMMSRVVRGPKRYRWKFVADLGRSQSHRVQGTSVQQCNSGCQLCDKTILVMIYCKVNEDIYRHETRRGPATARCQAHSCAWASMRNSKLWMKDAVRSTGLSSASGGMQSFGNAEVRRKANVPAAFLGQG